MFRYVYLLGFGSNLGDKQANLIEGVKLLSQFAIVVRQSKWIETAPLQSDKHDTSHHESYINFVAEVSSEHAPKEFYKRIIAAEDKLGHDRTQKWAPRKLDIDILFCRVSKGDFDKGVPYCVKGANEFCVPHAGFWKRDFLVKAVTDELRIDVRDSNG